MGVIYGDARRAVGTISHGSVQCCVTSPPYWNLRDYGHDDQIGCEKDLDAYISNLVAVFRDVRDALRDDGALWLNIGDSYHNKRLCGVPWLVANALSADGWILRCDVIWHKPNAKTESVKDRPTRAHEYLFLFSKSIKYYYDADAIREPHKTASNLRDKSNEPWGSGALKRPIGAGAREYNHPNGKNKRSVWTVNVRPYRGAHFAVFPEDLITPCVLSCTSPQACEVCGAPFRRVVEVGDADRDWQSACGGNANGEYQGSSIKDYGSAKAENASDLKRRILAGMREKKTVGWERTCSCECKGSGRCVVLDPFFGRGTTGKVAASLGRDYIGIELQRDYEPIIREWLGVFYEAA